MKWYLGIDVSKGYADFVLLSETLEKQEETFQLDDTQQGHEHLRLWLEGLFKLHPGLQLDCGLESTGGFENNWYFLLQRLSYAMPLRAARLNPSVVKNASKASLKTNKTDSESAREIATYLKRYEDQIDFSFPNNQYAAFRSLYTHLELVKKQKTQVINQLKQLLYNSFPELQRFCKQSVPTWVLKLLMQYPSPVKLARTKPEKIARIKGITLIKAQSLVEKAKASVFSRQEPTDEFLIVLMTKEIFQKQEEVEQLKAYLDQHCTGHEKDLLESIRGIGSYSAAAIMIQIEDIHRFSSSDKLVSYFGIHPIITMSGDKKMVSRMSKQGRPAIRAILYMCANSAVRADSHMKSIYARHRAKGKNHYQAIGVIMHKLLKIIWGVLTSGKPYDPMIDVKNQEKMQTDRLHDEVGEMENKRRMQQFDAEAPISRIATKKRKVHATSQAGRAELVRDPVHEPD